LPDIETFFATCMSYKFSWWRINITRIKILV
jgi:hypothetical protein